MDLIFPVIGGVVGGLILFVVAVRVFDTLFPEAPQQAPEEKWAAKEEWLLKASRLEDAEPWKMNAEALLACVRAELGKEAIREVKP